jgi:putative heme iron utilization protein
VQRAVKKALPSVVYKDGGASWMYISEMHRGHNNTKQNLNVRMMMVSTNDITARLIIPSDG